MNYQWTIHNLGERFELRCTTEFQWENKTVPVMAGEWYNPKIQNPESLKKGILESVEKQIAWWKSQQNHLTSPQ